MALNQQQNVQEGALTEAVNAINQAANALKQAFHALFCTTAFYILH